MVEKKAFILEGFFVIGQKSWKLFQTKMPKKATKKNNKRKKEESESEVEEEEKDVMEVEEDEEEV